MIIDNCELYDQYYTQPEIAKNCCEKLHDFFPDVGKSIFLEPSAGSGFFIDAISEVFRPPRLLAYDIDPKREDIKKADFLDVKLRNKHLITVGNPPFGKRSSLAIKFFNIAAEHSDIIAFIVPVQFEKYSVQKQLNQNFHLIYSDRLPEYSFIYDGKESDVGCVFQIWTKLETENQDLRIWDKPRTSHPDFCMYLYNNTPQALKFFNKKIYNWDFAVPRQGFYDYSERITDENELSPKVQYMFFKADNKAILDRLNSIDFGKLSKRNTTIPGFGKADVVMEYERVVCP